MLLRQSSIPNKSGFDLRQNVANRNDDDAVATGIEKSRLNFAVIFTPVKFMGQINKISE